MDQTSSPISV